MSPISEPGPTSLSPSNSIHHTQVAPQQDAKLHKPTKDKATTTSEKITMDSSSSKPRFLSLLFCCASDIYMTSEKPYKTTPSEPTPTRTKRKRWYHRWAPKTVQVRHEPPAHPLNTTPQDPPQQDPSSSTSVPPTTVIIPVHEPQKDASPRQKSTLIF
ncbi:hypothetical protein DM01DRAFT_1006050 [Hesseltinella vesiculosa]|uniref:Uncharacterized protein n=1 Tax=Hesseltinella vesiculosa TaxID=101127 RepID=A0A1X2GXH7_9FUNG|nr:hypothetical protein DM01DRAFT_1006050 [Hesseltinella vesiculosa]